MPDTTPPTLTLSGALSTSQSTWRTDATGQLTLSATDAGRGVTGLEVADDTTVLASDTQTCSAGACSMSRTFTLDLAALGNGVHELTAAAIDAGGLRKEVDLTVRVDRGPPAVSLSGELVDDQAQTIGNGTREVQIEATDAGAGVTALALKVDGNTIESATQTCADPGACAMQPTWNVDTTALTAGTHDVTVVATDGAGRTTTSNTVEVIKTNYPMPEAPPLSETEVTPFPDQVSFLHDGPGAVQSGLDEEALDERRISVITGKVFSGEDENGDPIPAPGVTVSVVDRPEFGETKSRETGDFFLVVNGGEQLRVRYEVQGALPAEREVETVWNDYVAAEDVRLIPRDSVGTPVEFGALQTEPQLVEPTTVVDQDGSRTARIYVRPETNAFKQLTNGTLVPFAGGTMRVTEYTVGENGPQQMPSALPDVTAYTWAGEFSIDEAEEPGVEHVVFDKPVVNYLDNFLITPVGADIPVGDYNWTTGHWEGDPDARVIEILDEVAGKAVVDVTGFGAATAGELADYGIDDDELEMLADTYEPGKTLWRTEMPRFSTKDINKPAVWTWTPDGRVRLPGSGGTCDEDCMKQGSIIGVRNQTLGEEVDLGGTPYYLRYDSARTPGAIGGRAIRVPITDGAPIEEQHAGVNIEVLIAGQRFFEQKETLEPNLTHTFYWDGKDRFGRELIGGAVADVTTEDLYDADYGTSTAGGTRSGPQEGAENGRWEWVTNPFFSQGRTIMWGRGGNSSSLSMVRTSLLPSDPDEPSRPDLSCNATETECWYPVPAGTRDMPSQRDWLRVESKARVSVPYHDARSTGVGGWGISAHHRFDTATGTLFTGDGERRSAESVAEIVEAVRTPADFGSSTSSNGLAVLADGSMLIAQSRQVLREWPNGTRTVFAGNLGATPGTGDGGAATDAGFAALTAVAAARDGSVFIADSDAYILWRVDPDGVIRRFAGDGTTDVKLESADPRASALMPSDVAVAPDGTVYVTSFSSVTRIEPSGRMTMLAGTGLGCETTGSVCLENDSGFRRVSVSDDGTVFWTTRLNNFVSLFRLRPGDAAPQRLMFHYAFDEPVEGPVSSSKIDPLDIDVDRNGRLLMIHRIGASGDASIWQLDPDGRVRRVGLAGCATRTNGVYEGAGGPFRAACGQPEFIVRGPDGTYIQERKTSIGISKVRSALSRYPNSDSMIPSEDGGEAYLFDAAGRHLKTVDGRTERTIRTFGYDSAGRLISINENDFGSTTIAYASNGNATVTGPDGQETAIKINADGWATSVTDAEDGTHEFEYTADGLLTDHTNELGKTAEFGWSPTGRLTSDTSRRGNTQTLSRSQDADETTVTHELATGEATTYRTEDDGNGRPKYTATAPDGSRITSQHSGETDTTVTSSDADGMEVVRREVADPRWPGAVSGADGTLATPDGKVLAVAMASAVVRDTSADIADPFDYQQLIETVSVGGRTATSVFDKDAATDTETTPMGRTTTLGYDEKDRLKEVFRPGRDVVGFTYDSRGRLIATSQSGVSTHTAHSPGGYISSIEDEESGVTTFVRDDVGRPVAITGPDGETSEFGYGADGQVTTLTSPDGREFTFSYDDDGNRVSTSRGARPGSNDPSLLTQVEYDDARRPTQLTRPSGRTLEISRDSAGRPTLTEASGGAEVRRAYLPVVGGVGGQLTGLKTDEANDLDFGYDGALLRSVTVTGDVPPSVGSVAPAPQVEIEYDNNLRLAQQSIGDGSGAALNYSYNDDDQLIGVGPLSIGFDAVTGDPETITAGATSTLQELNGRGELAVLHHSTEQGGTPVSLLSQQASRDGLGRITQTAETVGGTLSSVAEYEYDDAGRLSTVSRGGLVSESYAYDATGALTSRGAGVLVTSMTLDGHGRPTSSSDGKDYVWNRDGELSQIVGPGSALTEFEYDGFGRLRGVDLPDGRRGEYRYDALGRRTSTTLDGALVRRLVYGGAEFPQARVDASGEVVERYVYGSQEHVPDLILRRDGTAWRLLTDMTGSVRAVVDIATGAVVQELEYSSFGQVLSDTNPGLQPFGFKGSFSDPVLEGAGMIWVGVRAYLPTLARFSTADLAGLNGGWNQQDGLLGDPINLVDPDGRLPLALVALAARAAAPHVIKAATRGMAGGTKKAVSGGAKAGGKVLGSAKSREAFTESIDALIEVCAGWGVGNVNEGIYEFEATDGRIYVGQSGDIDARLDRHISTGKVTEAEAKRAKRTYVPGGKTAREIAEQRRIDEITDNVPARKSDAVANERDPIGPKRRPKLMP